MSIGTKYKKAREHRDNFPDSIPSSLQLAMGFLVGSEMYGCAAAVAQLYREKYGDLPSHMEELESE